MNRRQFTKISGLSLVGLGMARTPALASNRERQNQGESNWERYTVRDRGFSVLLPTVPAMTTYEVTRNPLNPIDPLNLIGAYAQGVVYVVNVFARKQSLEEFIKQFNSSYAGEFSRQLNVAGVSGKEYAFQTDAITGRTQYFRTDRYIFVFKAQGSFLGTPDVGMPKFFESIKFEPSPSGIAIVEGPGEQPAVEQPKLGTLDEPNVFVARQVTRKPIVVTKPEPSYTNDARKNQVVGTVVLRAVFASSGAVVNIKETGGLPFGLTEQAIESARQIRFIPAIKDGHFVSMYVQLEYSFNLY